MQLIRETCIASFFQDEKSENLKQRKILLFPSPKREYFTCSLASCSCKSLSFFFLFSLILETSGLSSLNSSLCSSTWKSGFSNMTLKRSSLRRLGRFWKRKEASVSYQIPKQTLVKICHTFSIKQSSKAVCVSYFVLPGHINWNFSLYCYVFYYFHKHQINIILSFL